MQTIHQHGVIELSFVSEAEYANPLHDAQLKLELTSPAGRLIHYEGFWDGAGDWRVRVSPDEVGLWQYRTACTNADDAGLHNQAGRFECVAYQGDNPLYRHGPLRIAEDGCHFEHADGTPFFWLADTAWNGVIRSDADNWAKYLQQRTSQRFTVIQFVTPHWRGDEADEAGRSACTETSPIQINPAFFEDKDARIAMINQHGLLAAPVVLWSLLETDLGYKLDEADAIALARYIVARYGAYQVAWLLGGDGNYQKMGVDRWQRLGRSVFETRHDRLVTLHPCGVNWVGEEFRDEPWYDFVGYQSGHGDNDQDMRWLNQGPPATNWSNQPHKPVVNLEPNYEAAVGYHHQTRFEAYHVRRAAYWSLLVSPTAGVTYGDDRIWNWNLQPGPSEGHGDWGGGRIEPWHEALDTPGQASMKVMRDIFDTLAWPELRPAPQLLAEQPGEADAGRFIAAAATDSGRAAVIYTPRGATIRLTQPWDGPQWWFDPRTGRRTPADELATPDDQDWLLVLADRGT